MTDAELTTELDDCLAARIARALAHHEQAAAVRRQFASRRRAGKAARHREREKLMTTTTTTRRVTCRYARLSGELCTGEALDPEADVRICAKHAARVMALVQAGLTRQAS